VQTKWQAIEIAMRECGEGLSQTNWSAKRETNQWVIWHIDGGWQDMMVYIDPANGKMLSGCLDSIE